MTIEQRVLQNINQVGFSIPITLSNYIKQWIEDGAKLCIDLMSEEEAITVATIDTTTSPTITNKRIFSVLRNEVGCKRLPLELKNRLSSTTSLLYPTEFDPVYIIDDKKVIVYPVVVTRTPPGISDVQKTLYLAYPTYSDGATSLTGVPDRWLIVPILHASVKGLQWLLTDTYWTTIKQWNVESPFKPTIPDISDIDFTPITIGGLTFNDVTFTPISYSPQSLNTLKQIAIDVLADLPTYNKVIFDMSVGIGEITSQIQELPTPPTDFEFEEQPPTLNVSSLVLGEIPTEIDIDFGDLDIGEIPDILPPMISPLIGVDFTKANQYIEEEEDLEKAAVEINKVKTYSEQYVALVQGEVAKVNAQVEYVKSKVEIKLAEVRYLLEVINAKSKVVELEVGAKLKVLEGRIRIYESEIAKYNSEMQGYIGRLNVYAKVHEAKIQTYIARINALVSLASQYVLEYKTKLELFGTKRQTEIAKYERDIQQENIIFQGELTEYQAKISKVIKQAELDLQTELTDVQSQVQLHINKIRTEIETMVFNATKANDTAVLNATKNFEAELTEYVKGLEKEMFNATKDMEAKALNVRSKLELFQVDVAKYGSEVQFYLGKAGVMLNQLQIDVKTIQEMIMMYKQELNENLMRLTNGRIQATNQE